eukprot:2531045-Karenia_brevis.AAC.1
MSAPARSSASKLTKNQRHQQAARRQQELIGQLRAQVKSLTSQLATAGHASFRPLNAAAEVFMPKDFNSQTQCELGIFSDTAAHASPVLLDASEVTTRKDFSSQEFGKDFKSQ